MTMLIGSRVKNQDDGDAMFLGQRARARLALREGDERTAKLQLQGAKETRQKMLDAGCLDPWRNLRRAQLSREKI